MLKARDWIALPALFFIVSYSLIFERPHLRYAGLPLGYWFLTGIVAALATQTTWWFLQGIRRQIARPRLQQRPYWGCLFLFNYFLFLYHAEGWRSSTDTMMTLWAARHYLEGLVSFPNFWFVADPTDISKNWQVWNYLWSPVTTWIPLPFMALFSSPLRAVQLMIYFTLLIAFWGWMSVAAKLNLGKWAQAGFGLFLVAYMAAENMHVFYFGDVFPFAAAPFAFLLLLTLTQNFTANPDLVSWGKYAVCGAVFGLLYLIKFSSIFPALGFFILLSGWTFPHWRSVSLPRALKLLTAAMMLVTMVALVMGTNFIFTGIASASNQWKSASAATALHWLQFVFYYPADLILTVDHFSPLVRNQTAFAIYALVFYLGIIGAKSRIAIPLWFLVLALITVPAVGMWYTSVKAGTMAMFVGRYRFPFAPFAVLILLLATWDKDAKRLQKTLCCLVWSQFVLLTLWPSARFLASRTQVVKISRKTPEGDSKAKFLLDPWFAYTPEGNNFVQTWNSQYKKNSLLILASMDDEFFQLAPKLKGRTMFIHPGTGRLAEDQESIYCRQHSIPLSEMPYPLRSSEDMEVFILITHPDQSSREIELVKGAFVQVKQWNEVLRSPHLLLFKGFIKAD